MLMQPLKMLEKYVNLPSGSFDKEDVAAVAQSFAEDFASLGFTVQLIPGEQFGPKLCATIGTGTKQLLCLGHMDTVFPHDMAVRWTDMGGGIFKGSGGCDMKGGIVIMLHALGKALPQIDLTKYSIKVLLNADEEVGSVESHEAILSSAAESFAVLSFEPGTQGRLTCARKGVTNVTIATTGIPGHAGAQYKQCASAIQGLCMILTKLYTLRDDEHDVSFNAGLISGGTASNVVAPSASCECEFRYFDQSLQAVLIEKIKAVCAEPVLPGVECTCTFGASHPAIDLNEKSQALLDIATGIAQEIGLAVHHEKTGGAGDISIAGQAGVGVLDGFGTDGGKMHTVEEYTDTNSVDKRIEFAARMLEAVCK